MSCLEPVRNARICQAAVGEWPRAGADLL